MSGLVAQKGTKEIDNAHEMQEENLELVWLRKGRMYSFGKRSPCIELPFDPHTLGGQGRLAGLWCSWCRLTFPSACLTSVQAAHLLKNWRNCILLLFPSAFCVWRSDSLAVCMMYVTFTIGYVIIFQLDLAFCLFSIFLTPSLKRNHSEISKNTFRGLIQGHTYNRYLVHTHLTNKWIKCRNKS